MFRKVADFAAFAISVSVAVRIFDSAASVSLCADFPLLAFDVFALVLDARFGFVAFFVDISFGTFADFIITFKFTSAVTAVERTFFILGQRNTVALFVFLVTVKAFAVFIAASVVDVTV